MKDSLRKGFGFGLTSGIITTLGMIVGLHSSTHSKIVVIGGILVIAVADAFSDAIGIHLSEEFEGKHSTKEIWESTLSTFATKLVFALTFILPVWFLQLFTAIIVSVVWGLCIITIFSFYLAKQQRANPYRIILEHLIIAILVIALTHQIGDWISIFI
ncbi:MAG: hypothetical protein OEZ25_04720 [Candidatus Bathyarchaeota archaeon]|nr:hypothetical protein [Candidatus Bathyarchaeota archaeon]